MAVLSKRLSAVGVTIAVAAAVFVIGGEPGQASDLDFREAPRGSVLARFGAPGTGTPGPDAPGSFNAREIVS